MQDRRRQFERIFSQRTAGHTLGAFHFANYRAPRKTAPAGCVRNVLAKLVSILRLAPFSIPNALIVKTAPSYSTKRASRTAALSTIARWRLPFSRLIVQCTIRQSGNYVAMTGSIFHE